MATVAEVEAARATAGARYLSAVEELRDALIDLAAYDEALSNAGLRPSSTTHHWAMCSFSGNPDEVRLSLAHPQFAPDVKGAGTSLKDGWVEAIKARADEIASSVTVG